MELSMYKFHVVYENTSEMTDRILGEGYKK
jgi:hypothetical protein